MTRADQPIFPGGDNQSNPLLAHRWRRPFAAFLAFWPLVSPTGFVGAAIYPAAADAD